MKNRKLNIFLSLCLIIFLSCIGEPTPVQESQTFIQYPLNIGNSWEYQRLAQFTNFRPDSLHHTIADTLDFSRIHVTIPGKKDLLGMYSTFILREQFTISSSIGIAGESYYTQDKNGLYLHAQLGISTALPKKGHPRFRFFGLNFRNIDELYAELHIAQPVSETAILDSLYIYDPPLKVLLYPLQQGKTWIYQIGDFTPITKQIGSRELISLPAGNFTADVVHLFYDFDNNGVWDPKIDIRDYYSAQGLIKRSIKLRDIVVIDENLNEIGLIDYSDVLELHNYDIQ